MCVHDCVHPWWGGAGVCQEKDAHASVCLCGAGYVSRDAIGNPSCVSRRALFTAYLLLALASAMVSLLLGRQMLLYRYLPAQCQHARKTAIRMRILASCSVYVLGYAILGVALAVENGQEGYFDDGFVQAIHILLLPSIMFAVSMVAEYWVATLPPQLIPPESLAAKLSTAAEKHRLFIVVGGLNAGSVAAFGVVTFVHPLLGVALADLAITSGSVGAITAIVFVAKQISGYINQAMKKASTNSRAFYVTAKTRLWQEALALCSVGVTTISIITVRNLTVVGRSTPAIMFTIQVLTGHVFCVVSALATRFQASAGARSSAAACVSNATTAGRPSVNFSMSKAAAFTARLSLTVSQAGGTNNAANKVRRADGVTAGKAATLPIELGTSNCGVDIARKGESPKRDSGTAKTNRVIPMVASTTVPPGGDGELESFGEEDSISCTYALQQS